MNREKWEEIKRLFFEASGLEGEERAAFLARECADADVRAEVEGMLTLSGDSESFLEPPETSLFRVIGIGDLSGTLLGDYDVREKIGAGGMGIVYRALQRSMAREVAIKVLVPSATLSARRIARFEREARAAGKLRHPGIVPIHAVEEVNGVHFYAMELVPGPDLRQALASCGQDLPIDDTAGHYALPPPDHADYVPTVTRICAEAAEALEAAHEARIVHRDVKPSNILLDAQGRALLVDFGLAKDESLGNLSVSGEVKGTVAYMSPEQARVTKSRVDHRTDIYSLGVVLYQALTRQLPFHGTDSEVLEQVGWQEPPPIRRVNARVPADLETICGQAMRKSPEDRYASAAEFAADLRRFLAGEEPLARRPSLVSRGRRFARRRRVEVGLGVVALVALAIGSWFGGKQVRAAAGPRAPRLSIARAKRVEVTPNGVTVRPRGTVSLRPIDWASGRLGDEIELGALPLDEVALEPGWFERSEGERLELALGGRRAFVGRLLVRWGGAGVPAGSFVELMRRFELDAPVLELDLPAPKVPDRAGMRRFEGGRLPLPDSAGCGCPNADRPLELAPYWLDETEVSWGRFLDYLAASGAPRPRGWGEWDVERIPRDLPVVGVTLAEARAFAEWHGKRLPTHAEWEFAARGAEGRRFPWDGNDEGRGNAGYTHSGRTERGSGPEALEVLLERLRPVRSDPQGCSPEGLYHLFGNAAELTESFALRYHENGVDWNPQRVIVMGGSWDAADKYRDVRTHGEFEFDGKLALAQLGFRCAASVEP